MEQTLTPHTTYPGQHEPGGQQVEERRQNAELPVLARESVLRPEAYIAVAQFARLFRIGITLGRVTVAVVHKGFLDLAMRRVQEGAAPAGRDAKRAVMAVVVSRISDTVIMMKVAGQVDSQALVFKQVVDKMI